MVIGHYATALVAKKHAPSAPLWFLLIASILLDILLVAFVLSGIEVMEPGPDTGKSIFESTIINATYSHDLVPVLGWCALAGLAGLAITRDWRIGLWGVALVAVHEICDLISGFPHYIMGPETKEIGLGLYYTSPLSALAIELILGLVCVWWFVKDKQLPTSKIIGLYAVIVLGVAALVPNAI